MILTLRSVCKRLLCVIAQLRSSQESALLYFIRTRLTTIRLTYQANAPILIFCRTSPVSLYRTCAHGQHAFTKTSFLVSTFFILHGWPVFWENVGYFLFLGRLCFVCKYWNVSNIYTHFNILVSLLSRCTLESLYFLHLSFLQPFNILLFKPNVLFNSCKNAKCGYWPVRFVNFCRFFCLYRDYLCTPSKRII